MTFRHLSTLLVALLCTVASAAERPNILFILIDDMGWMDIACQGNEHVHTPDINRLASEGIRFTDAYAAAPVCSPTRAAFLTGRFPDHNQNFENLPFFEN